MYAKKTTKKTITLSDGSNHEKKKPHKTIIEEETFAVKDDDDSLNFSQRTIDFDIKRDREPDKFVVLHEPETETEVTVETKKSDILKKLNESRERMKEKRMESSKIKENIDEFENEPAYKRKNLKIEQPINSNDTKISRYSLEDDEENNGATLNPNNSYLHDNVD